MLHGCDGFGTVERKWARVKNQIVSRQWQRAVTRRKRASR